MSWTDPGRVSVLQREVIIQSGRFMFALVRIRLEFE
jgi:hypothetical protein